MDRQVNLYEVKATLVRQKDRRFRKQEIPLSVTLEMEQDQFFALIGVSAERVRRLLKTSDKAGIETLRKEQKRREDMAARRMLAGNLRRGTLDRLKDVEINHYGPVYKEVTFRPIGNTDNEKI